jgi:hypothetical protein
MVTATMPLSSLGYVLRFKKFTLACPAFAEAATRRQAKHRHFGVQARTMKIA